MALVCSICHLEPEVPVVTPYGHVYERRLVEKHIAQKGTDPVTEQPLTVDQLIEIKAPTIVRPRPVSAASIPSLCKMLLDEWDAVMLAYFVEKQEHQRAKQELSHSLYQHDSATRVVARLQRELTAAREALNTLKPQATVAPATSISVHEAAQYKDQASVESMDVGEESTEAGLTEEILRRLSDKATELTETRKKRGSALPEGLAPADDFKNYKQTASHGLHSPSLPGILAVDVCPENSSRMVTGGNDKNAVVFDKNSEKIVAVLQGHTKRVTNVVYHPDEEIVFTGSQDQTIRIWRVQESKSNAHVLKAHEGPITGLSLHGIGDYLVSCSTDGHWAFSDIRSGKVLSKVQISNDALAAPTCTQIHPDGMFFATGTKDGAVKMWDVNNQSCVANLSEHHGAVTSLAFSENGYQFISVGEDSGVKLWDLRKLKCMKRLDLGTGYEARSIRYDHSGAYFAVGGSDVRIYHSKQMAELAVFNDHTDLVNGVCFGHMASYLTSVSADRTLKVFSL